MDEHDSGLDEYRSQVRDWLASHIPARTTADNTIPRRLRAEETAESVDRARALQRTLFDGGYAGITVPKEYGGQGLSTAHEQIFDDEAQRYAVPDFGVFNDTTYGLCAPTILAYGSEHYKRAHIPRILAGEELWVQLFSEPDAGSDLAAVTTRAERNGDTWLLTGSKIWTSGAALADYGLCLARTNWDVPKHRGVTWFGVPMDADGVTVQPLREISGGSEFCQEYFDNVLLTDDDVVGEVDQGWTVAQTVLALERAASPAPEDLFPSASGARQLAPDLVELARRRGIEREGRTRQQIARAHINDWIQLQLAARIDLMIDQGMIDPGTAAYNKLALGVFEPIRASIAMEIGGAPAVAWRPDDFLGSTTSLNYLNGRINSIAGGTNEMQRNGIGERVLGLPREPSFDRDKPFKEVRRAAQEWTGRM
jgi:alkylation response protein AidB-like acyl-CoA dehydrogenase